MVLADEIETHQYDLVAKRANGIYKAIKKVHPFLTSSEDATFCLLLAATDKSEEEILKETEPCPYLMRRLIKREM